MTDTIENKVIDGQEYFITRDAEFTVIEFDSEIDYDDPLNVGVSVTVSNDNDNIEAWEIESQNERIEDPDLYPSELLDLVSDGIIDVLGKKKGKKVILNFAKERLAFYNHIKSNMYHEMRHLKSIIENVERL